MQPRMPLPDAGLIESICARVRERLPGAQATGCAEFARQYYRWVPAEDLDGRSPADLYGAMVAHWSLMQRRAAGEAKVHAYNPAPEHHGWQSPHTVVEIVTDDMPFLVDSVMMELVRQGYVVHQLIHPVMRVRRDAEGKLRDVLEAGAESEGGQAESILQAEIGRERDPDRLAAMKEHLERVLGDVQAAVDGWEAMRRRAGEASAELAAGSPHVDVAERREAQRFLRWLVESHFTFLGYREYYMFAEADEAVLQAVPESGLGILCGDPRTAATKLTGKARSLALSPHPLVITKANSRSTVHRPAYLDYVGVKKFAPGGEVTGERRFLGLFTTAAYKESPLEIPILRGRVAAVMARAGFPSDSHDAKALLEILEAYPRDALFQMNADELFTVATGILGLGERQRLRLFAHRDVLDRFVSCLVCIPRDRFNTENRERVAALLADAFGGHHVDWSVQLTESLLARVHYIIHTNEGIGDDIDLAELEDRLRQATRAWSDALAEALTEAHGEERAAGLHKRYADAFPPAYRDDWLAASALADIARLEELATRPEPIVILYRPPGASEGAVRCKLFSDRAISLSDVLPTFEHMGAQVIDERSYEVRAEGGPPAWIYDFGLRCAADVDRVRELFQDAFLGVRRGELEDDGLNGLVLDAELTGREVTILRAIAKYLRQLGIAFSDRYMERTLRAHSRIANMLVEMFVARLDPEHGEAERAGQLRKEIEASIDAVESLDEDRILRSFESVVSAILRTNYFGSDASGGPRPYLSFKLDPARIPIVPLPRPRYEIFVYSPRVEGVHLRGGKVARGGLRWSDRREDFRTEILGLMKAQMVKNALIVPVGSKGGFVVKQPPAEGGREGLIKEAIGCYRLFLSGLLDLTDNIIGGEVVGPDRVVRYDGEDPYLVVAADKGTASFSDIANEVSAQYGFWLGDAFASGGSRGYDHKAMGITARGAWESVKRHFRELGTDIQQSDFTVIGIGDMSGDVFGNGMLLSRHIKLLAAFNHQHVFLDPDPDPEASFEERRRLFGLARSSWSDYRESLISAGGGVFSRAAKTIVLSPQVKEALAIEADELSPQELVHQLLRAPVDLLWNGGIGTYVKASSESHANAGDKTNDALRCDGSELRCRAVGEGGNLGFTQRGRIEYALKGGPDAGGGQINTDAIDSVAGVNCSDHEVNIKILLDGLVADGELTERQRNGLLVEMTDAVSDSVIYGSYTQTQAISIALAQAVSMLDVHDRLIRALEQIAGLDRELEHLPNEEMIADRRVAHRGLLAPELAVVMAYTKIHLNADLLDSDLPEDPYLCHDLERYFPDPLPDRYDARMQGHRLRREIITTVVANQLVDRAGTTFTFRLGEETGASPSLLARAYAVAREVFEMRGFWSAVECLDSQIDAATQLGMLIDGRRMVERSTRWLVRAYPARIDIAALISRFRPAAGMLSDALPELLDGADRDPYESRRAELSGAGVPAELARRVAALPQLLAVFDIVEVAAAVDRDAALVMLAHFRIGSRLWLNWLRERIIELPRSNRWQALARAALRDDLYSLQAQLVREVLGAADPEVSSEKAVEAWWEANRHAIERCLGILADIKASHSYDTTTLPVALREVRNLLRGAQSSGERADESARVLR
ncbi:MAG: NAD-glutamate dehydrogenase [Solirubrobacteraceae bacterium]